MHKLMNDKTIPRLSIFFDIGYDDLMSEREVNSLIKQICFTVNKLRQQRYFVDIFFIDLDGSSIFEKLNKAGVPVWNFQTISKEADLKVNFIEKKEMIYLSPDAEEDLEDVNKEQGYVIGGFVDRVVRKNTSLDRAKELGIKTRRLPVTNNFGKGMRQVFNVDTVVDVLANYFYTKDWDLSLKKSIPLRKFKEQQINLGQNK